MITWKVYLVIKMFMLLNHSTRLSSGLRIAALKKNIGVLPNVGSSRLFLSKIVIPTISDRSLGGSSFPDAGLLDSSRNAVDFNEFSKLGLLSDLVRGLSEQGFTVPTPVQRTVVPRLISGESIVMAACTGSGKTLAYVLPAVQALITQEQAGYNRQIKRPRCLILVPTRELARQVLVTIKQLSHFSKIASAAVLGGEEYALQKRSLDRFVDIVVASPGRLIQHKEKGNVYLSHVTHVIIDEVDTMLTQGFGSDVRAILRSVLMKRNNNTALCATKEPQLMMATATLTKAVKALLTDVEGGFNIEYSDPSNPTPRKLTGEEKVVNLKIIEIDGLHMSLPNMRHLVEETNGVDKILTLHTVLDRHTSKTFRTIVFCNTIDSCRAVEYALKEAGKPVISYHGDLNSKEREANLNLFRSGEQQYLVCTDIAARGMDIPEIDHVVMFDFPLNPIDYLHRAGRAGRAGRKGLVTSIVAKRDKVLSDAIQGAIARGLPIDNLTSSKRDYTDRGKLAKVVGRAAPGSSSAAPKRRPTAAAPGGRVRGSGWAAAAAAASSRGEQTGAGSKSEATRSFRFGKPGGLKRSAPGSGYASRVGPAAAAVGARGVVSAVPGTSATPGAGATGAASGVTRSKPPATSRSGNNSFGKVRSGAQVPGVKDESSSAGYYKGSKRTAPSGGGLLKRAVVAKAPKAR